MVQTSLLYVLNLRVELLRSTFKRSTWKLTFRSTHFDYIEISHLLSKLMCSKVDKEKSVYKVDIAKNVCRHKA